MQRLPTPMTYGLVLALFRVYMGIFWIAHGWGKVVEPQWAAPGGVMEQIVHSATDKSSGAYHDFITGTVLPNSALFAHLVAYGETLVGISLLAGLLSRLGALCGAFLALNYWFMQGGPGSVAGLMTLEVLAAVASMLHFFLPTGRVLGLDAFGGRRVRAQPEVIVTSPPPMREPPIARPVQHHPPMHPPPQ